MSGAVIPAPLAADDTARRAHSGRRAAERRETTAAGPTVRAATEALLPDDAPPAQRARLAFALVRFWKAEGDAGREADWRALGNRFWLLSRGYDPDASAAAGRLVAVPAVSAAEAPVRG